MNIRRSTQHIVPGRPFVPSKRYLDWKRFVMNTLGTRKPAHKYSM